MQPKNKKDPKPILFAAEPVSSPNSTKSSFVEEVKESASPDDVKTKTTPGGVAFVCIKFVEVNLLKIRTRQEIEGTKGIRANELSSKKREFAFPVRKDDIELSKFLKTNYLPEENIIEVPIPVNLNLPYPSFECLQKVIESIVIKEKTGSATYPVEVNIRNCIEVFIAACLLGLEELALSIYESSVKQKMNLKLLIGMLLVSLEGNLSKLFMEFYKIFREYWLYKERWAPEQSPAVKKLRSGKDDGTTVEFENEMICVYYKDKLEFAFPPSVFKRPFEMHRKELYRKFFKPEQKYYVLNVKRKRTIEENDGILESKYPHKYYLVNPQTNEVLLSAVRQTEYGDFYLYGEDETNDMIFGNNYVGHIEANTWGTTFNLYDDGIEEKAYQTLPQYICALRTQIATISFQTNFMGETPREIKLDFIDFAEKTSSQLVPMDPKYDEENDCYTLNFFGKAKLASARNFILTFPHNQENIILLHGKASKDVFNLDFRHPLNFIQAFSVSLTSIGRKFCVS